MSAQHHRPRFDDAKQNNAWLKSRKSVRLYIRITQAPQRISIKFGSGSQKLVFSRELYIYSYVNYRVSHLKWNPLWQYAASRASDITGNDSLTAQNTAVTWWWVGSELRDTAVLHETEVEFCRKFPRTAHLTNNLLTAKRGLRQHVQLLSGAVYM